MGTWIPWVIILPEEIGAFRGFHVKFALAAALPKLFWS